MINKLTGFITSSCLFFALFGFTNDSKAEVSTTGKELYQQCVACHGVNGEGNDALNAPAIAGQFDWYIARQIKNYNRNIRGAHDADVFGKQMQAIAKQLDPQNDVPQLSAYIQSLPPIKTPVFEDGNMANGSRYYQGKCGACHGGTALGNKSFNAPKLAGLSKAYLTRQMLNFSTGIRGYKAEDKLGRQMAMMAKTTSGQELDDIIYYIISQDSAAVSK